MASASASRIATCGRKASGRSRAPHAVGRFRIVVRIGLGAVWPNPRRLIRMTVLASDSKASTSATGAAQLIHINEYDA